MRYKKIFLAPALIILLCVMSPCVVSAETTNEYVYRHNTQSPYYQVSPHRFSYTNKYGQDSNSALIATFALIDTTVTTNSGFLPRPASGWTAQSDSNYIVTYCCDLETSTKTGTYYKRINLEDADYYTEENAKKIRGIVSSSYPFISYDSMISNLKSAGVISEGATVSETELLSAVQLAIWNYANDKTQSVIKNLYAKTDFNTGISGIIGNGTRVTAKYYKGVDDNIKAVYNYLLGLSSSAPTYTVISTLTVNETKYTKTDSGYNVGINFSLNTSVKDEDNIKFYLDTTEVTPTLNSDGSYKLDIQNAEQDKTYVISVNGVQDLGMDAYFYEPKGGRNTAQCFVGVSEGETPINASAEIKVDIPVTSADLKIVKIDGESKEPLSGAEFYIDRLVLSGDEYVKDTTFTGVSVTTDKNGEAKIEDLDFGMYEIKETKAPENYSLSIGAYRFNLTEDEHFLEGCYTLTIPDRPKIELPLTGSIGSGVFIFSGILIMLIALIIYFRRVRYDIE